MQLMMPGVAVAHPEDVIAIRLQPGIERDDRQPLIRRADAPDDGSAQIGADQFDQPVMNDFYDLLSGRNAFEDLPADRPHPHILGEILGHLEIHIGFQEGHANFLERGVDIFLSQDATSF